MPRQQGTQLLQDQREHVWHAEHECEEHAPLYPTILDDLVPWMARGITREDFDACNAFGFVKEVGVHPACAIPSLHPG